MQSGWLRHYRLILWRNQNRGESMEMIQAIAKAITGLLGMALAAYIIWDWLQEKLKQGGKS